MSSLVVRRLSVLVVAAALVGPAGGCAARAPAQSGEPSLPFPPEEVVQTWPIGDRHVLVELAVGARDRCFYIHDRVAGASTCVVGAIENAVYEGEEDGRLTFWARNDGDTGDFDFPCRLAYDLLEESLSRAPVSLPLSRPVAFGKHGWKQILTAVYAEPCGLVLEFLPDLPDPGEVLAGGHNRPVTTVAPTGPSELALRFYSVAPGDALRQAFAGSEHLTFSLQRSLAPEGGPVPFTVQVSLEAFPEGAPLGEDAGLLTEGLPYGLSLADPSGLASRPCVILRLRIADEAVAAYAIETSFSRDAEGGSVFRYVLTFK